MMMMDTVDDLGCKLLNVTLLGDPHERCCNYNNEVIGQSPDPSGGHHRASTPKSSPTPVHESSSAITVDGQRSEPSHDDEIRPALAEKTSVAVSPGTVKEKVQMLKMTSEGNLTAPAPQQHQMVLRAQQQRDGVPGGQRRALSSRNSNHDSDDKCSVSTLDPLRREFCRKAMVCDYQAMQKMLQEDSSLARSVDYVLGYNALHWAAKYGNCDVVKLIAGTYNVDANIRTRGAGQTPLHIAYMFNQKAIIDLLIMTYGAQKDIRDFSGHRPDFYGNQKNVETLRSKIYQTEKDKSKEDRSKEFSSKRHHKWPVWLKETQDLFEANQASSEQDRSQTRTISRSFLGRVARLGAREDAVAGGRVSLLPTTWRRPDTLRSVSLMEGSTFEQRKANAQQQQQQCGRPKEPDQQQPRHREEQQEISNSGNSRLMRRRSSASLADFSCLEQENVLDAVYSNLQRASCEVLPAGGNTTL